MLGAYFFINEQCMRRVVLSPLPSPQAFLAQKRVAHLLLCEERVFSSNLIKADLGTCLTASERPPLHHGASLCSIYTARFSLHQVNGSQCTSEYYILYSWRALADVYIKSTTTENGQLHLHIAQSQQKFRYITAKKLRPTLQEIPMTGK